MSKNGQGNANGAAGTPCRSSSRMAVDYILNHDGDNEKYAMYHTARARTPKSVIYAGLGDTASPARAPGGNVMGGVPPAAGGRHGGIVMAGSHHQQHYQGYHHAAPHAGKATSVTTPISLRKGKSGHKGMGGVGVGGVGGRTDGMHRVGTASVGGGHTVKERKFECDQCGSAFGMKSNLKRHIMTVHEDRRGWRCDICGAAFGLKQNLGTHVRVKHEKKRPFMCDLCGVSFGYKQVMQNHRRNIHGVE